MAELLVSHETRKRDLRRIINGEDEINKPINPIEILQEKGLDITDIL